MTVIEALLAHHVVLRDLFARAEADVTVFEEARRHLVVHHTMEEKYFYDVFVQKVQGKAISWEAVNEHHIIELILKDAEGFPREHERFGVKMEGLFEYTNHHLLEEEQEVFPLAQTVFSAQELESLGVLFEQAKELLLGISLPVVGGKPGKSGKAAKDAADAKVAKTGMGPVGFLGSEVGAVGLGIGALKSR